MTTVAPAMRGQRISTAESSKLRTVLCRTVSPGVRGWACIHWMRLVQPAWVEATPLGSAGRTGRVIHGDQVVPGDTVVRCHGRGRGEGARAAVQDREGPGRPRRQGLGAPAVHTDHLCARVRQQGRHPAHRQVRVERQERPACFEDGQEGDGHLGGAVHPEADRGVGDDSGVAQSGGQVVGAADEGGVGERGLRVGDRRCVRTRRRHRVHQIRQQTTGELHALAQPAAERRPLAIRVGAGLQSDAVHRPLRVGDRRSQQGDVLVHHPPDGVLVEERGGVLPDQRDAVAVRVVLTAGPLLGPGHHHDVHVHLGRAVVPLQDGAPAPHRTPVRGRWRCGS